MQSAVPRVLEVLDRRHRPGRPEEAVAEARAAGFEHVNLDLIYGAPYETDADWQRSLDAAIAAGPDHISAYALVVEHGTALARQVNAGVVPAPDDDVLADRYVMADETLAAAGYPWYEVSNWARSDAGRCRHNELYWSDSNWWGVGPGAHSHVSGVRWWNVKHPVRYTAMVEAGQSPAAGRETLDETARYTERVMLGVRLRDGLPTELLTEPSSAAGCRSWRAGGWSTTASVDRGPGRADPARPADGRRRRTRAAGLTWFVRIALAAERVEVEDPDVDDVPLLQGRPQGPVQAVLEVDLALPLHGVREQVAVEGRILVQQPVQGQLALGGDQLVEAHRARGHVGPVPGGEAVIGVGPAVPHRLEDHARPRSRSR